MSLKDLLPLKTFLKCKQEFLFVYRKLQIGFLASTQLTTSESL